MKEKELLAYVKSYFPYLAMEEVTANNSGWDNDLLIINNKLVFRFLYAISKKQNIDWNSTLARFSFFYHYRYINKRNNGTIFVKNK